MLKYIIIYSITLFLVAATTVTIALLYVRSQRKHLRRRFEQNQFRVDGERAFLNIVSQSSQAFILACSDTQEIAYVSPNVQSVLGVTAEELINDTGCVRKTVNRTSLRTFERKLREWDKQGVLEMEFESFDQKYVRLEAARATFEGREYTLFVLYDISAQKAETDRLQREREEALHLAAERSSFLSNMSHEIRTPMNGIMGMMSLAKMNISDKDRVLSYLDKAGNLASFLIGVINDILDISKMESGRMLLYNTNFDIIKFADKIQTMFSSTMQSKGINYKVETIDFTVRVLVGDELRLTQIVTNLVSNAQKFTPVGGSVTVTFKQLDVINDNIQLMIRCRDTGKGIAPENIRKIMKPFVQEDAGVSHKYGGTGLGLALTDNFVKLMGGNIVVDSVLGQGSDFSVFLTLPIANVVQDMEIPVQDDDHDNIPAFTYEGCRILLAEDNAINAEIAIEMLESEGAKVTLAQDGLECVEKFTSSPADSFDLILMDIQMPRMNGRDATRAIRSSHHADAKKIIIVALSADAFVEDTVKSKAAGMDGHVSKPIDFDELKKTLGEIFATKKKKSSRRK